jgi:ABC-type polar amino acid transport system ATPase subunit
MGPSGSGKTTILRAIASLDAYDSGTISVDGRGVGMVFQFHCLFEHLPSLHNVWLAPVHAHGVRRDVAIARARELLRTLGVEHRADALPRELSGGEAQRVAVAAALAHRPVLVLADEPSGQRDARRRVRACVRVAHSAARRRSRAWLGESRRRRARWSHSRSCCVQR